MVRAKGRRGYNGKERQEKQVIANSLYRGCKHRRGLGERKSRGAGEGRMKASTKQIKNVCICKTNKRED